MPYDVVTLGETMLRLTPPGAQLIEQSLSLTVHVGGSESNVAVGLARLGHRVAWLSRLTDNSLGRSISRALQTHGVDVSHITWTREDRVGLYFLEEGPPPRGSRVTYDRAGSAMSRIQPDDLPKDLFAAQAPAWLHVSGISLAISRPAAQTTLAAAQRARAAGWHISFDVNHRAALWPPEAAANACEPLAEMADVVFLALRDAAALYNAPDEPDKALRHLQKRWPAQTIVLTLGAAGAAGISPGGDIVHQSAYPAHGSGRIGGGDAFVAGFLSSYQEANALPSALMWGAAAAAYKYTLPGDMPLLDRNALQAIMQQDGPRALQR